MVIFKLDTGERVCYNILVLFYERQGDLVRYDPEYDHIELSADRLCFELFSRHDLGGSAQKELETVMRLKRELAPRVAQHIGGEYYSAVELSNTLLLDGIYYYVTGTADGIVKDGGRYALVDIRIRGKHGLMLGEEWYMAREWALAYFLCRYKEISFFELITVTYATESGELDVCRTHSPVEMARQSYINMLSRVHRRAEFTVASKRERVPSLSDTVFPYRELRDSQEQMIKECYRDIKNHNRLFCQAPTGIGKTISTLYPAIKCVGQRVADKIFYLTSKASIRREALAALKNMREHGAPIYTCTLSSKEQMCINPEAKGGGRRLTSYCHDCPFAKGYYTRRESAIFELIDLGREIDREDILRAAQKHRVCPHELSLDLSELCDVIICDYNYVFSPSVYLKRYFADSSRTEKYIFLVDEAHNLPDRARELFSARLGSEGFLALTECISESSSLWSACGGVLEEFDKLSHLCEENSRTLSNGVRVGYSTGRELPEGLSKKLTEFYNVCDRWLRFNEDSPIYTTVESLWSQVREYSTVEELFGGNYLVFINTVGDSCEVLLYCLDPSSILDAALSRAEASVLFSATLTPAEYFADVLGGGKRAVSVRFPSPFPPENLCVVAVDGVSTRYEDRDNAVSKVASCIAATVAARSGNYIVFLPSYSYMEKVADKFSEKYPKVNTVRQQKGMSYSDREKFMEFFADDGKRRVGFCVLGGMFSEGIDLPGERLIGVVVVGVGLPGLSNERNIMRDYYEEKCAQGYDYAYTYPGMNSVLQAVGRVIRRDTDRGVAVLIDDRFAEPKYRELFPDEWKHIKYARNSSTLAEITSNFWKKQD